MRYVALLRGVNLVGIDSVMSPREEREEAWRRLARELPMDKRIVMRWWQVPRAEIPADRDERIDWLFGWWERIDAWIQQNRPEDLPSGRLR